MNQKVHELLNQQINKEFYSAYLYLDFSNYFEAKGLDGFANWYRIQAQEERDHAMLFYDYLQNESQTVTLDAIANIKKEMGDQVCVGAGTVMTVEQVRLAAEAGAEYMISPNTEPEVIYATKQLGKVSIPGAMTPTEVAYAYQCGADIVKMFPAGILGPGYIKAVKAPLKHVPVTAVGGVNAKNCVEFFKAGASGVGVGGNLVSPELVNAGRFDEITALALEYTNALKEV